MSCVASAATNSISARARTASRGDVVFRRLQPGIQCRLRLGEFRLVLCSGLGFSLGDHAARALPVGILLLPPRLLPRVGLVTGGFRRQQVGGNLRVPPLNGPHHLRQHGATDDEVDKAEEYQQPEKLAGERLGKLGDLRHG